MKKYCLFFIFCLFICNLSAQLHSFYYNGIKRTYIIKVPPTYDGSKPFSLILALHGLNSDASYFSSNYTSSAFMDQTRTSVFEYITVFPNGTTENGATGWNCGDASGFTSDDVGFISVLIDTIKSHYNIDSKRVFATGHSMGGYMCYRLAVELSNKLAAIASVEGLFVRTNLENKITKPIPILHIHALDDPSVPYNGFNNSIPGVDTLINIWKYHNHCIDRQDTICNQNGIIGWEWTAPETGADVALYQFISGGHSWLSNPLNSTDLILDFFYNHPKLLELKIVSPANNSYYSEHSNIELSVDSKSNASISKVEFFANNTKVGEDNASPYKISWDNVPAGEYVIHAKSFYLNGSNVITTNPAHIIVFSKEALNNNIALGRSSRSSSEESGTYSANFAFDGNKTTRWASQFSDPQWISVELDTIYTISKIILSWEAAYGKQYEIQTAIDTTSWQTVYTETKGNGRTDEIIFNPVNARFVRLFGIKRATSYGYSLYEFEIYKNNFTEVNNKDCMQSKFNLSQNYPNPFNPVTIISYEIPYTEVRSSVPVQLKVYDMLGQEVATLVNEEQSAGKYKVNFDGKNCSSGIYLYKLSIGNFIQTKKMILLR